LEAGRDAVWTGYGQDMDKMNWLEKKILLQILKIQLERLANSNMKLSNRDKVTVIG
jgi:hypothetical protein